MNPSASNTVLDVGVTDTNWRSSNFFEAMYPWPSSIVAVAPGTMQAFQSAFPDIAFRQADGRRLPFGDDTFDIGFSNAVIEHVGSREEQRLFATEISRVCRRAFVCTPNSGFPIDPHTLLPLVHRLPRSLRQRVLRLTGNSRWASEEALNPLSAREFVDLFPAHVPMRLVRQRAFGMTSVLIAVTGVDR